MSLVGFTVRNGPTHFPGTFDPFHSRGRRSSSDSARGRIDALPAAPAARRELQPACRCHPGCANVAAAAARLHPTATARTRGRDPPDRGVRRHRLPVHPCRAATVRRPARRAGPRATSSCGSARGRWRWSTAARSTPSSSPRRSTTCGPSSARATSRASIPHGSRRPRCPPSPSAPPRTCSIPASVSGSAWSCETCCSNRHVTSRIGSCWPRSQLATSWGRWTSMTTRRCSPSTPKGARRGVVGSPHFFTPGGDFFCPSLDVSRDAHGHLRISADPDGFDAFVTTCLS